MCLKPIPDDFSFLDANGKSIIGFGEVTEEESKGEDILPLKEGFIVGVTCLIFALKMF